MGYNSTSRTSEHRLEPFDWPWFFVCNGASDPTEFSDNIESVERLATATPTAFYRITFVEAYPYTRRESSWVSVANTETDSVIAVPGQGLEADPGAVTADPELQYDVMIIDEATGNKTTSLTGNRVMGAILFDRATE